MSIESIMKRSGLRKDTAESLYWHSFWLRQAPDDYNVNWNRMLNDKKYRLFGVKW